MAAQREERRELTKLLASVTIASGGVVPNVHPAIAKKK